MTTTRDAVPRVSGHPVFGNLREFRSARIPLLHRVARDYGDIARLSLSVFFDVFVLSSPELAQEVLVKKEDRFVKSLGLSLFARPLLGNGLLTSEHEEHRTQRRLMAPAFTHARIASYADVSAERAERGVRRMLERRNVDVSAEAMRVTLEVVGKTLFDAEIGDSAPEVGEALTEAMDSVMGSLTATIPLPPQVPSRRNRRLRRAVRSLDRVVYGMIAERRANPAERGDLLSLLLSARDEAGEGGMSDAQVRDEAMTLFLAGHETVANAVAWTLYLLGRNEEVRARLEAEVDGVLGDGPVRAADLPRLSYTTAVLKEAMRLYPPAYFVTRRSLADVEVGGHRIPKNSLVIVNIAGIQRRADVFPDPERFDPERFAPAREKALPRLAYMPFGAGPRICIGNHFAMMEGQILLATFARRARFELADRARRVEPDPLITLRPDGEILMRVGPRDAAATEGRSAPAAAVETARIA